MSEQKAEKKVVSRTVAIALGIICIILVVGLVGAIVDYRSIISDKDHTASSQISNLQNQVYNLTVQVFNLTAILNQQRSKIWVLNQPVSTSANANTSWTFSASYAGSVFVTVVPAYGYGDVLAYIRVIYRYGGVHYDNQISNSTSPNIGDFPILPSSNIQIIVGTSDPKGLAGNVTMYYFY